MSVREDAAVGPEPFVVLACLLVGWQAFVSVTGTPTILLPSPVEVAATLVAQFPTLLAATAVTGLTAGIGLCIGLVVGLAVAFLMVSSRSVAIALYPYVVGLRITPLLAIAPLFFLWIGDGVVGQALLVGTVTPFPVAIASYDALESVPPEYVDLAASVGASPGRTFLLVRVPAAAPSIFAGVKIAATLSVVSTVVAEFLAFEAGLGYQVFHASQYLRTRHTFAALVALAAFGVAFYSLPVALERRFRRG